MGSQEDSQEKTEEATPRKVREARKRGQIAKSRDLVSIVVLLVTFTAIAFFNSFIGHHWSTYMLDCFRLVVKVSQGNITSPELITLLKQAFFLIFLLSMPAGLISFLAVIVVSFLQTGAVFSTEPLQPSLKKINPIEGFKNIFKLRSVIELIKSTLKIGIVFLLAYFTIKSRIADLVLSVTTGLVPTMKLTGQIMIAFIVKVGIFFLVIAIFDLLYQRWQYAKDLRMSKYELIQEFKRDEGDPMLKSHRRQFHQELINQDMKRVKRSDVVIVNPIHLAIAVVYDRNTMRAPEIVAKGQRLIAEQIKNLAKEANVPVIENVPLAHALFEWDPGDEIPEDLYEPMAEILSFVFRLREKQSTVS